MPMQSVSTVKTINYDAGGISITGKCNIGKKLSEYQNHMQDAIADALRLAGGKLESNSVQLTPIDTGELRSRAFVSDVYETANSQQIVVGYEQEGQSFPIMSGDNSNKYSIYVHERLDVHHPVGQAKFLETATKQFDTDYQKALQVKLKQVKP